MRSRRGAPEALKGERGEERGEGRGKWRGEWRGKGRSTAAAVRRAIAAGTVVVSAAGAVAPAAAQAAPQAPPLPDTISALDAVERALGLDPLLSAARAGEDAAGHALDAARAGRLPTVASSATLVRFQEPMVVAPLHGFDIRTPPSFDRTLVQGRLGVEWTVFDGGATGARIRAAEAASGAASARAEAVRQERIAEALEAYLAVLSARDVEEAARRRGEALEEERDRASRFLAEGASPRLELLRAEAALSSARAGEETALGDRAAAEARLARLLEVPTSVVRRTLLRPAAPPTDDPTDDPTAAAPDAPDAAVAPGATDAGDITAGTDLTAHPDLMAARERAEAALASAAESSASWWPDVRATGAFQEYGSGSGDFTGEWQAGLRLSWPVFTGGARDASVDGARAAARRAVDETDALERELRMAADRARAAERQAAARVEALGDAVEQYDELTRIEALALAEGAGVQSDFLRAQAGLYDARAALAQARRAVILARTALARAEGRLTLEWIEENTAPIPPRPEERR